MTTRLTTGVRDTVDGRPALRFERRLDVPPERAWRALTDPAELASWFPSVLSWTPELGEEITVDGEPGTIVALDPPRLLAWTAAKEHCRFELRPDAAGCLLIFTHVFDDAYGSEVQHAAGWEAYLDRLGAHLDGGFLSEEDAHVVVPELVERYEELFAGHAPRNTL
jgi:uncharacterized protein YndB with AHSA1/START domain